MVNLIGGRIRHMRNLAEPPDILPLAPGSAQRFFNRLRTREFVLTRNGGLVPRPYSAVKRDKTVAEIKPQLLRQAYAHTLDLDGPDGEFWTGTFRRLNELQTDKSGKTPEECMETIEQLKTELTQLEMARDQFRARGDAKNERIPRITETGKNAYLAAEMAKEVADAVMLAFNIIVANGQTGAQAKATLDNAVNSIVNRYDTMVTPYGWAGWAVGCRPKRSPEWIQARLAANAITGGPSAYNEDGSPGLGIHLAGVPMRPLPAPGAGMPAPVDDARNGLLTANDAVNAATVAAKTKEGLLKQAIMFKGAPTFEAFARRADDIERKLMSARDDLFKSLCHLDKINYLDKDNFKPHYQTALERSEQIADIGQKLDGFRLSLGFPALRKDKLESSGKYQFKQWWKENAPGMVEFGGSMALTGAEYGAYCLIAGGAIPSWLIGGAAFVAATTINTVAIKAIQYMASDD